MRYYLTLVLIVITFSANSYEVVGEHERWKIPVIAFESIDIGNWDVLSRLYLGQGRYHLRHLSQPLFLKLWTAGYYDRDRFIDALECQFYAGLTDLLGVVIDERGEVRGYLQPKYTRLSEAPIDFQMDRRSPYRIHPLRNQPECFKQYVEILVKRSEEKGHVYYDLSADNVMWDGQRIRLVDLESICSIREFATDIRRRAYVKQAPAEYMKFLLHCLRVLEIRREFLRVE